MLPSSVTTGSVVSCTIIAARRSERFVVTGQGAVVVDSGGDRRGHCRGLLKLRIRQQQVAHRQAA